jgi:hypothetical protein
VIALLGPLVFWLLLRYARDFSRRHWSLRIARFPFFRERWTAGPRPMMSALVALLFVIVPIYCQGHLIRKFGNEGSVYANVKSFGLDRSSLMKLGECLNDDFCKHPDAGRYSVIKSASGSPREYFDHAYQYGEPRPGAAMSAVTFFPILQPVAVFLFSAAGVVLLVFWVRAVLSAPDPATMRDIALERAT